MSTPDLPDDELDALCRQAAEAYPRELNPGAWQRLESQLDEQLLRRRVRRAVLRLFGVEALLGLVAALWYFWPAPLINLSGQPSHQPHHPATASARTHTPSAHRGPALAAASAPNSEAPAASAPVASSAAASRHAGAQLGTTPTHPAASAAAPPSHGSSLPPAASGASLTTPTASTHHPAPAVVMAPATSTPAPVEEKEVASRSARRSARSAPEAAAPSYPTAGSPAGVTAAPQSSQPIAGTDPSEPAPPTRAAAASTGQQAGAASPALLAEAVPTQPTLVVPAIPLSLPPASSLPVDPRPLALEGVHRLNVGFLVAPELTTVRMAGFETPGYNVGLQLEYRLSPRFRARLGAIRSLKHYTARGEDYRPKTPYWDEQLSLKSVKGTSKMMEVPLDLRYDFIRRPFANAFISVGAASLLVWDEDYACTFVCPNGGETEKYYGSYDRDTRLFNTLTFSLGYERMLSDRWSVQAEPFAKLPLSRRLA